MAEARSRGVQTGYPAYLKPGYIIKGLASETGYMGAQAVTDDVDVGWILSLWKDNILIDY